MDNKSVLKKAKEAFKEKEYKVALKHCKTVLKSDKSNYNAWILVGATLQALEEFLQSEAAYKKAIEISSDLPLAWQGLCNLYESSEKIEHQNELFAVYKKLIQICDKSKTLEVSEKFISYARKTGNKDWIFEALKFKLEFLEGDQENQYIAYKNIFDELLGQTNLNDQLKELQTKSLHALLLHPTATPDSCSRYITTCIEPLFKSGDEKHSLDLLHQIYEIYPENSTVLEYMSRIALSVYMNHGVIMEGIKSVSEKMKSRALTKGLSNIMKGFVLMVDNRLVEAIQELGIGLERMDYCIEGWFLIATVQLLLHQYQESERSAKAGLQIATKSKATSSIIGKFCLLLGKALSGRQKWDSALKAFEKCVEHNGKSVEIQKAFCLTLMKIGHLDEAEKMCHELRDELCEDAEVLQLEGYALLLRKRFEEALKMLRQSVVKAEFPFTLHLIALVLWESDQQDKAFKIFIKAAESDPHFSKNFMYLGHYYANHLHDKSKAQLCYKKAFHLDPSDYECGMILSNILKDLGKHEENIEVLKTITEKASLGSCKWAWTQLGLHYFEMGFLEEAIIALQNALRADPDNSYSWECLADAYLKRGSFESALKAFDRAAELSTKAMYPLYQVSTIQKMRGFYVEAIEKYKNLLDIVPTYIPALIGLAESYILLAKKCLKDCLYGLTKDYCEDSLKVLARVATENPGLSCLWKLAGDACTIPYHLDDRWFPIRIPPDLVQNEGCTKSELLIQGSKFYGCALSLKENVSSLWHDLGINYHFQSQLLSCASKKELAKKAFICMQKAVSISPDCSSHWTALGAIALGKEIHDHALGQHVLIKSLEINPNNAEAWTCLGVLYLENGDIELAHKAFKKAQSAEPVYPLSWIGQAFIADKVQHIETMDLYRHATTLGSHKEALLGYARAVCQALLNSSHKHTDSYKYDIEQMNAVVAAMDCAIKYSANNSTSPEAFNVLGLLYERQGIYSAATKAYERALSLIVSRGDSDDTEKARANYARTLSILGKTDDSLKEFLLLKKIDISLLCSFASALFKGGQYEKAYKLFKQAFEMSKHPPEKSHIKVAMAMVAVNLHGPEFAAPLTLLLESSQIEPASVPGLLALYAHGLLKGEKSLALAAEKELVRYKFHKDYSFHVAFLRAASACIQHGPKAARNELLKMIHCQPDNATMWLQMAQCLLLWDRSYAPVVSHCTRVGVFHGGDKEVASQVFALCQISAGYKKDALSAAQKAVHVNPEKLTNWTTLAAACHVANKDRKHTGWLFSFVKGLAKKQGIKRELLGWLVVMEAFHHISSENMSSAKTLINQGLAINTFGPEIQSVLQVLSAVVEVFSNGGKIDPLVIAVKNNPKCFLGWHVLCQFLIESDRYNEAEKTLVQFREVSEKLFPKWKTFPLLQLAALSHQAINAGAEDKEKWLKTGETAVAEALKVSPSQGAHFLQGVLAVGSGEESLAKKSLENVLLNSNVIESRWMETVAKCLFVPFFVKKRKEEDVLNELELKFSGDEELKQLVLKSIARS